MSLRCIALSPLSLCCLHCTAPSSSSLSCTALSPSSLTCTALHCAVTIESALHCAVTFEPVPSSLHSAITGKPVLHCAIVVKPALHCAVTFELVPLSLHSAVTVEPGPHCAVTVEPAPLSLHSADIARAGKIYRADPARSLASTSVFFGSPGPRLGPKIPTGIFACWRGVYLPRLCCHCWALSGACVTLHRPHVEARCCISSDLRV